VKKRVLYFIIVLALVLCLTLPMATPVMASIIDAAKHPIPLLPNIYRIGDMIYYEMRVGNPVSNNASNYLTRIWDTLPSGTVIDFLDPGEPLIQAPGENATFYANYTVVATDIVWLSGPGYYGVTNHFEAEGVNSDGAGVYVHRTAISQVIQPDIDIEKYVWDGAGWQDADAETGPYLPSTQNPVVFKFEIDNTGDVELTDVNLTDTDMTGFYTDQGCTIPAVFPIPTLYDDDPIVTVYGKLAFTPGQHSNNATVIGTPPVEDPVSDSDPAHYFGSGASIGVQKHVWDGSGWDDADTPTGPYLTSAQNPVVFRFVITNNDNVNLTNVTLTDTDIPAFYTNQACTIPATFPIPTLATSASVTVYGKLAWAQGQHSNNATATGTPPVGAPVSDSDPAHYFGSGPSIDVEKHVWDGSGWDDADLPTGPSLTAAQNPVVFRFVITNNGNVDLTGVNLTDTDMSAFYTNQGLTNPATFPILTLATNASVTVYGSLPWAQGQHTDTATATGTPPVGAPVFDTDPANYFGLPPSIDVEKHVWDGATWHDADTPTGPSLTAAQNPVVFRFVITNNCGVNLTNVTLSDVPAIGTFYTNQGLTNPATFPILTLATNASVTVYGSLPWAPGQQTDTATATGTPPVGAPVSDTDPANYFGSPPSIDVEKHVWDGATWHDADTPTGPFLTAAQNPVVFRFVITNNCGVNLTNVTLSDVPAIGTFYTNQGLTTPGTLPIPTLAPTASQTFYGSLPWAQGQHSNTATATGTPPVGAPVSDSDPSHYFGRNVTLPVGWETYPINKVRVLLPWIALLTAIIVGASLLVLRHRRAQS